MVISLMIFIAVPLFLIWWLGTNPIPDFSFSVNPLFIPILIVFGLCFAVLSFFQGYFPRNSRENIVASFLSVMLLVYFFFGFFGTAFTGEYGTIVYEYSGFVNTIEVFWWYVSVGLLLVITAVILFIRIYTWESPKEEV